MCVTSNRTGGKFPRTNQVCRSRWRGHAAASDKAAYSAAQWYRYPMRVIARISWHLILLTGILALTEGVGVAQEQFRLIPEARFLFGMDWSHQWVAGEVLVPAGGQPGSGTKIDVDTDLGVNQGEASSVTLEGVILDNHLFNADFLMFSPTGMKRIPRTFRFHNKTYEVGTVVDTRIDLYWLRVSYGYKALDYPPWWIAPRVGVHYIGSSTTLNGETREAGVMSNTRSLDGVYPVLGLEGRLQFPHGIDFTLELEGTHLITRGFLTMVRLGVAWEVYPDIVINLRCTNRLVQCVEDFQPLNNEWFYIVSGVSGGISFGF
ncbi:MAG: hypothetical protein HY913_09995 [Desulfomonile tiedjei]|nr:hypothetical protein [Desulfomonile tiedjei]